MLTGGETDLVDGLPALGIDKDRRPNRAVEAWELAVQLNLGSDNGVLSAGDGLDQVDGGVGCGNVGLAS